MKPVSYLAGLLLLAFCVSHFSKGGRAPVSIQVAEARATPAPPPKKLTDNVRTISAAPATSTLIPFIESADTCGAYLELTKTTFFEANHVPALLTYFGASSAMQETFAADGPVFGPSKATHRAFHSSLARFFGALKKAGLIYYGTMDATDLPEARRTLLTLEAEDPSNAAFPYFRFEVENRMKLSEAERLKTLELAANGSRFDLLFPSELREIQSRRFENPAAFFVLDAVLSNIQSLPRFPTATDVRALSEKSNSNIASALSRLMMEDGLRAQRGTPYYGFYGYQYDEGLYLGESGKSLSAWDLSMRIEHRNHAGEGWFDTFLTQNCDPTAYEASFREIRNRL